MRGRGNNKKKWISIQIITLIMAIIVAGCSGNGETSGGSEGTTDTAGSSSAGGTKELGLMFHFKSGTLDPSNDLVAVRAGIAETLVRLDENLEVQPWLATEWTTDDNQSWEFTIRDGVTFHDGSAVDAAAVKSSLERAVRVNSSLGTALKIDSMTAEGQKLIINTTEAHPALVSELINPYAAIISTAAEEEMGTDAFNLAPVGTGPFKVDSFTPNIQIDMIRNDHYWDGASPLDKVVFKFNEDGNVRSMALQSGEVDVATQLPAETVQTIEQAENLSVKSIAGLRVHFLLFNQDREGVKDLKVRQALDLLLDRESIANNIMMGHAVPANGPFNTRLPFGSQDEINELHVERAQQLLEEAGYTLQNGQMMKDGKPLTLKVLTYKGRPELPLIAQLLQSEAAKAGITINIQTVENVDTTIRENKDWDIVTYSNLSAPRGDGGYFLNSAFMPDGALNATDLNMSSLTSVLDQLNETSDPNERIQLTQEAVEVIKEEVPHAYAVYPNIIVGMNDRVTNWEPGAEEYYIITNKMDVE